MDHHCDCAAAIPSAPTHCEDHSGQLMWMRGIAFLLVLSAGLLSYSVFWQAPAIQTEIARDRARVDGEIRLVSQKVDRHDTDISDLQGRVTKLEESRRRHAP